MLETDYQVALLLRLLLAFTNKKKCLVLPYGLALCGILVACNSLKTITSDKLYQRIDYFRMLVYTREFNLARYQTTLFVEFWFRKNRTTYDKTRLYII